MALTILCLEYKKHCTEWVQSGGLRGGWVLGLQMDHCAKTIISLFFSRAALHHFFSQPPTPPPASTPVQGMQASPAPALILIPLGIFNKQCISYASALYPWVCRKKNQEMISLRLGECLLASTVVNSTGMLPAFYFWRFNLWRRQLCVNSWCFLMLAGCTWNELQLRECCGRLYVRDHHGYNR